MAKPHHRRMLTIQELLESQRQSADGRCRHCGRHATERDHQLVESALLARIRSLEARLGELGVNTGGQA